MLGLCFCARAFSSCGERGPLFITVRGPLTVAASLVAGHSLQTRRLSSCGSRALLLCGMWDLPRPGLEPVSPALAGSLSTTAPPGKPPTFISDPQGRAPSRLWLPSLLLEWSYGPTVHSSHRTKACKLFSYFWKGMAVLALVKCSEHPWLCSSVSCSSSFQPSGSESLPGSVEVFSGPHS